MDCSSILYVVHTGLYDRNGFVGGTQLHVKELASTPYIENVYILYYEDSFLYLTGYKNQIENLQVRFPIKHSGNPLVRATDYHYIYALILSIYKIDVVHINHFQNHTIDLVYEAKKCDIPVILTLHDFYMLCPSIYLTDIDNKYCEGKVVAERCEQCLMLKAGVDMKHLLLWREEMKRIFEIAAKIITPSSYVKNTFELYYPVGKYVVIPHGQELKRFPSTKYTQGQFNVAYVGNMVIHKGSKEAIQIIKNCKDKEVHFHSFGKIFDEELEALDAKNFEKYGLYSPGELQELLAKNQIHVVAMLSNCPESFSYTLSEVWQCGIPVIACDIGALGSRIRSCDAGLLVNPNNVVAEVIDAIVYLKNNPDEYQKYCLLSQHAPQKTVAEMVKEYQNVYEAVTLDNSCNHDSANSQGFVKLMFPVRNHDGHNMEVIRLQAELNAIRNSISYKLSEMLKSTNIPGKEKFKKILIKVLNKIKNS